MVQPQIGTWSGNPYLGSLNASVSPKWGMLVIFRFVTAHIARDFGRNELEFSEYLRTLGLVQIIGVIGFLTYLAAFGAVQCGRMDGNSLTFTLSNMTAALCVGVSLLEDFNLAAALIQASYFLIGAVGLFRWMSRPAHPRAAQAYTHHDAVSGE